MNKQKKINKFSWKMNKWFNQNKREMPWRETNDPYKIWISEMMLQQTTVKTVINHYKEWIKKYPTIESITKKTEEDIVHQWQGLGYYQRARNIYKSAKIIVKEYQSKVPEDKTELEKLPGFGKYTIGAVLSLAYGKRETIVDANVRRVIMRICMVDEMADNKQDKWIEVFLTEHLPKTNMRTFNQSLMELGALICKSKDPLCHKCPLNKNCESKKYNKQERIPQTKKIKIEKKYNISILLENENRIYIYKNTIKGLFKDFWEFPYKEIKEEKFDKIEIKDFLQEILNEEISKESKLELIGKEKHYYTKYQNNIIFYKYKYKYNKEVKYKQGKWVNKEELSKYTMHSGNTRIRKKIL